MLLKSADESAQAEGQAIFTQLRHATGILEPEDFHDLPLWAVVGKMGRIDYAASVEDHASPVKTGLASLCDTAPRRSRAEDGDTVFPIRDRSGAKNWKPAPQRALGRVTARPFGIYR
jgi:hypothetical protein